MKVSIIARKNCSSAYETKFSPTIFLLHWKDHLKSLYNFFDRIFVTALLFEIFNFILFENYLTSDVILHSERLLDCLFCSI